MGTSQADRNLVDFSLNLGVTFHEPFLHRDDDTFGVAMGFAHVSRRAAGLDGDTAAFTGTFNPARTSETFVEVTYQYSVAPWLQLQPDFQYVFNPGGGLANPSGTARIKDEAVIGVRTNIPVLGAGMAVICPGGLTPSRMILTVNATHSQLRTISGECEEPEQ